MTKVAIQSSASLAAGTIRHALSDKDIKKAGLKSILESQAKLLAHELGQLKGSLMKVGQMLALYGEHFFPKEVVNALKSLQEDSPPLEWESIYPIIKKRLDEARLEELEIEQEALAAASMGQVHLATIKSTGEKICLKVQYPAVAKAIDNDIKTLRSILSMMRLVPKHSKGFDEVLKEIGLMLRHEVDYVRELQATDQMRDLIRDQDGTLRNS